MPSLVIAIGFGLVLAALFAIAVLVAAQRRGRSAGHPYLRGAAGRRELAQRAQGCRERTARLRPDAKQRVLRSRSLRAEAKRPRPLASLHTLSHGQSRATGQAGEARSAHRLPGCDVIRRSVALAKQGDRDAATALVASGAGAKLMDEIITEMSMFFQTELDLLRSRQETSRQLRLWLATLIASRPARRDRACRRSGGGDAARRQRTDRPHARARDRIQASPRGGGDAAAGAEDGGRGTAHAAASLTTSTIS